MVRVVIIPTGELLDLLVVVMMVGGMKGGACGGLWIKFVMILKADSTTLNFWFRVLYQSSRPEGIREGNEQPPTDLLSR